MTRKLLSTQTTYNLKEVYLFLLSASKDFGNPAAYPISNYVIRGGTASVVSSEINARDVTHTHKEYT